MNRSVIFVIAFLVAIVSAIAGFKISQHQFADKDQNQQPASSIANNTGLIGSVRPDFSLPDIDGNTRSIAEWDGKVIVINFWATWCPPCRKEIPEFIDLQNTYEEDGLQFIGIALQQAETAMEFINELGINYPILAGEEEVVRISRLYGNHVGALPYTVIINRESRINFVKQGPLSREAAEQAIRPLL